MLGCKFTFPDTSTHSVLELIDTCWDVNPVYPSLGEYGDTELIDTCWDVN